MAQKMTTLKVTPELKQSAKEAAVKANIPLQEFTRVAISRHINHVRTKGTK